jgi:thymine-DNA glycosylase
MNPQAAELSTSEMAASVPSFLRKVARFRPRLVCFVGKGIWQIVEKALVRMIIEPPRSSASPAAEDVTSAAALRARPDRRKKGKKVPVKSGYGLQRYQLVYDADVDAAGRRPIRRNLAL